MADTGFLLIDEVAALCRASPETVRHWIKTGRLSSIRPARRRLIARAELERFLHSKAPEKASATAKTNAARAGERGGKP